jgi:hypothetical protein
MSYNDFHGAIDPPSGSGATVNDAGALVPAEGGTQSPPPTPGVSDCTDFAGAIVPIVAGLNPEFRIVVSGHTHRFYLANGGDGFTNLTSGTDRVTAPGFDIDALVAHLGANAPVAPGPTDRISLAS